MILDITNNLNIVNIVDLHKVRINVFVNILNIGDVNIVNIVNT